MPLPAWTRCCCSPTLGQDNIFGSLREDNDAASFAVLLGQSSSLEGNLLNVCQFKVLHLRELGCLLSGEHCVLKTLLSGRREDKGHNERFRGNKTSKLGLPAFNAKVNYLVTLVS